jgi:Kdo2-lipid IVA lauroyltransferase/acyltransferase
MLFPMPLFLFLYYFPSYRRKVVSSNLRNSFPEKSREELRSIEKKFYKHLADLFIETLKLTHMGKQQLMKRFTVSNIEITEKLLKENRDIIAVLGHYNNWEWLAAFPYIQDINLYLFINRSGINILISS